MRTTPETAKHQRSFRTPQAWAAVAVAGIGFQVFHFVEHVAQLTYWGIHPGHPPWLTPWAEVGRDALALDGDPATGSELLHLVGNVIFLAALLALWRYVRGSGLGRVRALHPALVLQGFHLGEHVLLTATWVLWGRALGLSTLFGALSGPSLGTYRIWWHFLVNLAATVLAVAALLGTRRLAGGIAPQPKPVLGGAAE
jgi:hypothetical protein